MEFLEWDEQYSTNIEKFDNDHKQLFIVFNGIYNQIFECKSLEDERILTRHTIFKLLEYIQEHFTAEEEMMERFEYSECGEHKQEHEYFIAQVNNLATQYNEGVAVLSFPTFMFLKEWILKHIMVSDQKYAKFFSEEGIV